MIYPDVSTLKDLQLIREFEDYFFGWDYIPPKRKLVHCEDYNNISLEILYRSGQKIESNNELILRGVAQTCVNYFLCHENKWFQEDREIRFRDVPLWIPLYRREKVRPWWGVRGGE